MLADATVRSTDRSSLADDLDIEGLTARSEHGVLIVTIPVIAAPQPRKIQVDVDASNDVVND